MNVTHGGNIFSIARKRGWSWEEIADFSASINPLGPSPSVNEAIRNALPRIVHYPDTEAIAFRNALASKWNIPSECLLPGNGATELIHFFARTLRPQPVTLAAPVFSEFHRAFPNAAIADWHPQSWPTDGLLVITRPANPTGQLPQLDDYLHATSNPVLVDESFLEFAGEPSLLPYIEQRPNFFVLRSLTKFYALPGLRVGVLAASQSTLDAWRLQREPWQVNVLAEAAALAAIADEAHGSRTLETIRIERAWLQSQLAALPDVHPQPSTANYLLIALDYPVAPLAAHLLDAKILVRDCSGWPGVPFPHAIRIAVRLRPENQRLIDSWKQYTQQRRTD